MMKRIAHIALLMILGFSFKGSHAQQELMVSQYMFNQMFLNPAYAGSHEYWESSLLYRNQ